MLQGHKVLIQLSKIKSEYALDFEFTTGDLIRSLTFHSMEVKQKIQPETLSPFRCGRNKGNQSLNEM